MEDVNTLEITEEKLSDAIKQQFGNNKDFSVTDNGDRSFLVNMNDTQRMYYIDETGEVIDQSKMLKISTADKLKAFRDDVNSGNTYEGWYVYLTNDITLNINEEWDPIGLYLNDSSTPDNENNKPFTGTFDGCGYKIDGIYINTTDKAQGLFGLVNNGKILNIGIDKNCNINGNGIATSSIVGVLYNNAKIVNSYNESNLKVGNYSGGIVGVCQVNSEIINCYNAGNIATNQDTVHKNIGGIVGNLHTNSKSNNCYNTGNLNVENYNIDAIGGIAGRVEINSKIESSFNTGNINGQNIVGGITGENSNIVQIQNCYNIGNISGYNKIGGISGQNTTEIFNCYNIGFIAGTTLVGGITGQNLNSTTYNTIGVIRNSYSLVNVADSLYGGNNNYGIIENSSIKTEQEMKSLVQTLGVAFKEDINSINNGYPILQWQ